MFKKSLAPLLAATALVLSTPAHAAGSEDRARTAIAAAEAKIQTAEQLGASTALPREAAEARAALAMAREHFKADRNSEAIQASIRATTIADTAIGQLQQDNQAAVATERAAREQDVAAAAREVQDARDDAATANARASAAERSAAAAAAEASAARDAAARAAAQPEVETTVTTENPRAATRRSTTTTVKRKTSSRAPAPTERVTTTTTVKQPSR